MDPDPPSGRFATNLRPSLENPTRLVATPIRLHERIIRAIRDWITRNIKDGDQLYMLILAVVVGLLMGVITALFRYLIDLSFLLFFRVPHGTSIDEVSHSFEMVPSAVRLLLPAFGGLIVGFLIYRMLKLSGGHGVPSVMRAIATGNVNLSPGMAVKSSSSIITITSGGSCGPEGPIIEIGSVVGSVVGRHGQVTKDRVGTLIGCGAASGIAAVFNAPIGGVFLALELLMRDFAVRTFGPVVVAAVVASVTSEALLPGSMLFPEMPAEVMTTIQPTYSQIIMFAILGVLCGLGGGLLVYALYKVHDFFHGIQIPLWYKPALGGLMVGVIGLAFPNVIGEGYEFVREDILLAFSGHGGGVPLPTAGLAAFFLFIALVKILATSFTLGSGGTGGSFAPAMVTGAMFGGGFGVLCNLVAPEAAPAVPVFALVGMAGTVCSALNIPIAGILIAYEVSGGNYRLMLPLMITVAVSAFVASFMRQGSVYTLSLLRDGFDVEEALRKGRDPLTKIPVRRIMNREFTRVAPGDNLEHMIHAFRESEDDAFAVVDDEGNLMGMVSTQDLRGVLNLAGVGEAIIAADAAEPNPKVLYPDSPVSEALAIFANSDTTGIPVLAKSGSRKIVGMVGRVDALSAYREKEKMPLV